MKLICESPPGTLRNVTTANNVVAVAKAVKSLPGVGKPFLIFQSLQGQVVLADFELHPEYVVNADPAENAALINAMLASPPTDALTFAS